MIENQNKVWKQINSAEKNEFVPRIVDSRISPWV